MTAVRPREVAALALGAHEVRPAVRYPRLPARRKSSGPITLRNGRNGRNDRNGRNGRNGRNSSPENGY